MTLDLRDRLRRMEAKVATQEVLGVVAIAATILGWITGDEQVSEMISVIRVVVEVLAW